MDLFLGLIAAVVFAFGSIIFKRAFAEGAGVVHGMVINNVLLGLMFLPLLLLEEQPIPWSKWYLPAATALAFTIGHLLNVISLKVGDVSLVTPLLGAKVIFVAILGWSIFGVRLDATQWVAALLATAGVVVMGISDLRGSGRAGISTILALGCSAAFALTDMTLQQWGSSFGVMSFLALQFAALAIFSAALLPFFGVASLRAPRRAWKWILVAAVFSGLQAILITWAIAVWKNATAVNVAYATRGLWSIALVWFIGHHFRNAERQQLGPRKMFYRLGGAALILVAVALTALK
jgi:drug/metabolite transporter (DMT)-like permease